jgi:rhamnosyltransferase
MLELVSVVIRTLNEEKHLPELLKALQKQKSTLFEIEVVIVDSGSTDNTLKIAKANKCRVTYIKKEDFTFGRSLNYGCKFANGKYLAFVSGHCIPTNENWLHNLIKPLADEAVVYSYGKQIGRDGTKFSERQLFDKYFPDESKVPQIGFFCNNANSAIIKTTWEELPFDESLTGCEDMYLAKKLVEQGQEIGYVANSVVFHIHEETWLKVRIRYEREAIALQKIMPEVHVTLFDMFKYIVIGVLKDVKIAFKQKSLFEELTSILQFRFAQYYGAYRGNHVHRKLSKEMKMKYFYPRATDMNISTTIKSEGKLNEE